MPLEITYAEPTPQRLRQIEPSARVRDGDLRAAAARLERVRAILLADDLDLVSAALSSLPDSAFARRYAEAARLVRRLQAP